MRYTIVLDLDEEKREKMAPIFDAASKGTDFYGCKVICISNGHAPAELEELQNRIAEADTCEGCINKFIDCDCDSQAEDDE